MIIKEALAKFGLEEKPFSRSGLYSEFDGNVLYSLIRHKKPKVILDFAPREGRSSCFIINALLRNLEESNERITYVFSEREKEYLDITREWTNRFSNKIDFHYLGNAIEELPIISSFSPIDFLFVDASHDFILTDWYIKNLFPLVSSDGFIHIHDSYYDRNGNGFEDAILVNNPNWPPEQKDELIYLYGKELVKDKFKEFGLKDKVTIYEGDILRKWYEEQEKYNAESTITLYKEVVDEPLDGFVCALYFFRK